VWSIVWAWVAVGAWHRVRGGDSTLGPRAHHTVCGCRPSGLRSLVPAPLPALSALCVVWPILRGRSRHLFGMLFGLRWSLVWVYCEVEVPSRVKRSCEGVEGAKSVAEHTTVAPPLVHDITHATPHLMLSFGSGLLPDGVPWSGNRELNFRLLVGGKTPEVTQVPGEVASDWCVQ